MNCNCNLTETIIAVIIILFTLVNSQFSEWIILIAAVVLLIHALSCKACAKNKEGNMKAKSSKRKK